MRNILGITLIILLGLSELVLAQTAEDTMKSLKNIEARIETGVSYQDYPQLVANANREMNIFLGSNEAKKNPQFAKSIKKAMDYYLTANEIWDIKFNCMDDFVLEAIAINNNCGRMIKKLYPNSKAEILPGNLGPVYVISNVLRSIFNDASKELKKASEILKSN